MARLDVGVALGIRGAPDINGAVVAGAVAHKGLDDVEEGLIAGAEQAVGEIVRMWVAALTRDGVDRLDLVRAHLIEPLGGVGDDIAFAHAGLQFLEDLMIDAVYHGGGLIEQHDLVDILDLARVQHGLLGVAHFEEPLPQYDFPGLRQVVDALDCAISTGEQEISAWRFRDLMMLGNPDILQPDILNVGGLSEVVRVYEMAVANNKVVMPHSPSLGANSLASLHAYSTVTNAVRPHEFSEEFTGPVDHVAALFVDPIIPENGVIKLPGRPGLGVELDEKALAAAIVA